MKQALIYLAIFLVAELGAFQVVVLLRRNQVTTKAPSFTPTESTFKYNPPSSSLAGQVTALLGEATKTERDSTESAQVAVGTQLLVGESLVTSIGSTATLALDGARSVELEGNSSVTLSSGLSPSLLLIHSQGVVIYKASTDLPLSVRLWHCLITHEGGAIFKVTKPTRGSIATVEVIAGQITLAQIDKNNQTQVLTLTTGQSATNNDATRKIALVVKKTSIKKR